MNPSSLSYREYQCVTRFTVLSMLVLLGIPIASVQKFGFWPPIIWLFILLFIALTGRLLPIPDKVQRIPTVMKTGNILDLMIVGFYGMGLLIATLLFHFSKLPQPLFWASFVGILLTCGIEAWNNHQPILGACQRIFSELFGGFLVLALTKSMIAPIEMILYLSSSITVRVSLEEFLNRTAEIKDLYNGCLQGAIVAGWMSLYVGVLGFFIPFMYAWIY